MKIHKYIIPISLFILAFVSACKKDNDTDVIYETRSLSAFDTLELNNDIHLILCPDTSDFVVITGTDKQLPKINTKQQSTTLLTMTNTNKANWLRSFEDTIIAELHYTKLSCIVYNGSGSITSLNTIKHPLTIDIHDGTGNIRLDINNQATYIYQHLGCTDLYLTGHTENLYLYNAGVSPLNTLPLSCQNAYITNSSFNNISVWVTDYLWVRQLASGTIFYCGNPKKIDLSGHGEGSLTPQ